jgi:type IX secretion system substrate protein
MKKLLILAVLGLFVSAFTNKSYPVVKVNFYLANPHIEGGRWTIDVMATVLTAQLWRVGSSNVRVDFVTFPTGAATTYAENPAPNANTNLSNPSNSNYSVMTTTSINGGTAMSLNITRLSNCYYLTPGNYRLGSLRWNRIDTSGCIRLTIRVTGAFSVVQDSISQWLPATDWTTTVDTVCKRLDYLTGIDPSAIEIPTRYELYQNFPNPFNPVTLIKYDIPKTGLVTITLYDVLGKEIRKLVNENVKPGRYEITWDAKNFASGSYFYKIVSGDFTDIKKMILVK